MLEIWKVVEYFEVKLGCIQSILITIEEMEFNMIDVDETT